MGIVIRKPKEPEARKMFEKLERERKARIKFQPGPRVQIPKREPLDIDSLFNLSSNIWGIPKDELLPKKQIDEEAMHILKFAENEDELGPLRKVIHDMQGYAKQTGQYSARTHRIIYDSQYELERELQLTMALGNLLVPKKFRYGPYALGEVFLGQYSKGVQRQYITSILSKLLTKNRFENHLSNNYNTFFNMGMLIPTLFGGFFMRFEAMAGLPKAIARRGETYLIPKQIEKIYDKHGLDGLLLYLIFPPRVMGTLETIIWRKRMIDNQLLEPNGGLTQRGIEFVRKVLPKEEILRRLQEMRVNREKAEAQTEVKL